MWPPKFGGTKWQELQLVGSLVAIAIAVALHPSDYEERFEEWGDAIYDATDSARLARPSKTQTNIQWNYVARIVTDLLEAMRRGPNCRSGWARGSFRVDRLAFSGVPRIASSPTDPSSRDA